MIKLAIFILIELECLLTLRYLPFSIRDWINKTRFGLRRVHCSNDNVTMALHLLGHEQN